MVFWCPECRTPMAQKDEHFVCPSDNEVFPIIQAIPVLVPPRLDALAREEVEYHDHFDENATDAHQLRAFRNAHYHRLIQDAVVGVSSSSPQRSVECRALEVGAGSGHDARALHRRGAFVVETDISHKTLLRTRTHFEAQSAERRAQSFQFVTCSADALPFPDASFDAAFAVATIHHLSDPAKGLKEMARVVHEGGRVVVGMEPNATYFRLIKCLRPALCRAVSMCETEGSRADAEMEGFSERDLQKAFVGAGLEVERVIPVWFFLGFLHYGLEFLFRALKLKKRMAVPKIFERMLFAFDRIFFLIPGARRLCWHWIVIGNLKSQK